MANSPPGWQYPQPPMHPQGPMGPGAIAQPLRPPAMRRAVNLMYVGAILAVAQGLVEGLTTNNVTIYSYSSTSPHTATVHHANSLVGGIIIGLILGGFWLWMAWKTGAGRNWARVLSSVFFGLLCLQFIGGMVSLAGTSGAVQVLIVELIEWGVGLAAIIQLWRRESSDFFAFAKQAKMARAYGAAYPGYQPLGYGQAPQYGQAPESSEPDDNELSPHDD